MKFHSEWKTIGILIRWLLQKPADLDLTVFLKKKRRINPGSAGQGLRISIGVMMNHLEHKKHIVPLNIYT